MGTEVISDILSYFCTFVADGYWIVFLIAFLDSTFWISRLIPGSTIMVISGVLCQSGHVDALPLLVFAVAGALLGDNCNYYFGLKYGFSRLNSKFRLWHNDEIKNQGHAFTQFGVLNICFERFIHRRKELMPLMAGHLKISKDAFFICDLLGVTGWALTYLFLGYFLSRYLNVATLWSSQAGLLLSGIIMFLLCLLFLKWLTIKTGKKIIFFLNTMFQVITHFLLNNKYIFYWNDNYPKLTIFVNARMDSKTFAGRPLTIILFALFYVVALFAGIIEDFITSDSIVTFDIKISNVFYIFRSQSLTHLFLWITLLGKLEVISVLLFAASIILWLWQKKVFILPLLISALGSLSFTYIGKLTFQRARPEFAIYQENSFSFPSGHTAISVAIYGFMGYLLIRFAHDWSNKVNIFFITVAMACLIGLSRVYLGVHYISDIWCGYLVGGIWLIIAIALSEWLQFKSITPTLMLSLSVKRWTTGLVSGSAFLFYIIFSLNYQPLPAPKQPHKSIVITNVSDIFTSPQLKQSENLIGTKPQNINFIFITKNRTTLMTALTKAGWIQTDTANIPTLIHAMKSFITRSANLSAPAYPAFWNFKMQDLTFRKQVDRNTPLSVYYLKIWQTSYISTDGKNIFVGLYAPSNDDNANTKNTINTRNLPDIPFASHDDIHVISLHP
jgi:Uncharacterized membrane-associated protein